MTLTYSDKIKLAQSHIAHARGQVQEAVRLLSIPDAGVALKEPDYNRLAILASSGAHLCQVDDDINAELAVAAIVAEEILGEFN